MEPKPKERIVFDEDSYYGDEGAEWAVNDLMERKGLTEDEVRDADADGYSLSGEARGAVLSRSALPENRKAALDVIRKLNMAEDFGDSTGSGLVNTAKQAAKEVVQAVVTKGAGIGGKGGGGISLSGEAKDMMAASKQLAGASAAPSREHLVAKPDLSR